MKKNCTHLIRSIFFCCLIMGFGPLFTEAQTIISYDNLALGKTATASSVQTDKLPLKAFDGNPNTRFSSLYNDNEWLSVDLGQMYLVSQVVLVWERAYGKDFDILFSRNGSFTDLSKDSIQIRNNLLGTDSLAGTNIIKMKANTIARYVRMQGVHRATVFGYSLFEFQVAGATAASGLLPVTLTGFAASVTSNSTLIEWTTTMENNTAGFSVERSNDGTNFNAIGWVDGVNGGNIVSHYSYTDKQIANGKNYYRLKIFDLNGKTGSTPAVSISAAGTSGTRAYPVPVKDHIVIEYKGTPGENVTVLILNTAGQPVYNDNLMIRSSQETMIINRTAAMVPGIYFLTIRSSGNNSYSEQIILQ